MDTEEGVFELVATHTEWDTPFTELYNYEFQPRTRAIEQVLRDANMTKFDIDDIVMVGGPEGIEEEFMEYFGKAPRKGINRNEVVLRGAIIQTRYYYDVYENVPPVQVPDLVSRSLGKFTPCNRFVTLELTN